MSPTTVPVTIRDARDSDVPAITAIYNHLVRHSTAVWDETLVDHANRSEWLAARHSAGFPVIVAVDPAGGLVGYASYGEWRARSGYRRTVEHTVHVRDDRRGGGLGEALLHALIERARMQGRHAMIAGIEAGNLASIRLHRKLGFVEVGQFREVGTKFGAWLDLMCMQLTLDGETTPPA